MKRYSKFAIALLALAALTVAVSRLAAQVRAFSATGVAGPNTKVKSNVVTGPFSGTASAPFGKFTGSYVATFNGNNTDATVQMSFKSGSITLNFTTTFDHKLNLNVGTYVITSGATGSGTISWRGNADGTATVWMSGTISP